MSNTTMSFNKFAPNGFEYNPKVTFDSYEFRAQIGPCPTILISRGLQSTGLVTYHHLLVVANDANQDVYFVSAESNPIDGPEVVYLCFYDPSGHGTKAATPLLLLGPVFFCAACRMTRDYLGLDFELAPITEPERQALEIIPDLCDKFLPDWREHSRWIIEFICDGLPESHPGYLSLTEALGPTAS